MAPGHRMRGPKFRSVPTLATNNADQISAERQPSKSTSAMKRNISMRSVGRPEQTRVRQPLYLEMSLAVLDFRFLGQRPCRVAPFRHASRYDHGKLPATRLAAVCITSLATAHATCGKSTMTRGPAPFTAESLSCLRAGPKPLPRINPVLINPEELTSELVYWPIATPPLSLLIRSVRRHTANDFAC